VELEIAEHTYNLKASTLKAEVDRIDDGLIIMTHQSSEKIK